MQMASWPPWLFFSLKAMTFIIIPGNCSTTLDKPPKGKSKVRRMDVLSALCSQRESAFVADDANSRDCSGLVGEKNAGYTESQCIVASVAKWASTASSPSSLDFRCNVFCYRYHCSFGEAIW
jgi:hypothetical protein